jgi:DNA-directed RNA polymerase specialized sigma24 family protein
VADLFGLDRGTVKKHADRGLEKLRSAMEVNVDA